MTSKANKDTSAKKDDKYDLGEAMIESLNEIKAWKEGKIALEVINIDPMPVDRIREIRRKVAKTAKEFEHRFGIPASTISNWEQGRRKPDLAARILLKTIESNPKAVEKAVRAA